MMMAHADGGEWVTARPGATLEEKRLLSAGFTNVVSLTFELTGKGKHFFPPTTELGASLAPTPNTPDLVPLRAPARGETHDGHDALAHQERNAQVRRARL